MEIEPGIDGPRTRASIVRNQVIARSRGNLPKLQVPRPFNLPPKELDHRYLVTRAVRVPPYLATFRRFHCSLVYRNCMSSLVPTLLDIEKLCLVNKYREVTNYIKECRVNQDIVTQKEKDWIYRKSIHMMQEHLLGISRRGWMLFLEDDYTTGDFNFDFYCKGQAFDNPENRSKAALLLQKNSLYDYPALHMFQFWVYDVLAADIEAVARASFYFHEGMRFLLDLEKHLMERSVRLRLAKFKGEKPSTKRKSLLTSADILGGATGVECHSRLMKNYYQMYCTLCGHFPFSGEFFNWHRLLYHSGYGNLKDIMDQSALCYLEIATSAHLQTEVNANAEETVESFKRGCV